MVSDRLSEQTSRIRQGMEEAGSQVSDVGSRLSEAGSRFSGAVREQFQNVRDSASEMVTQGARQARRLSRGVESEIRNHPTRWLLISAGVGIGVGLLAFYLLMDRGE